jgi:hypothetical protein
MNDFMPDADAEPFLTSLPYFRGLRADEYARVSGRMRQIRLETGSTLVLDAEAPALLVVVVEGRVALSRGSGVVATLFAGDSLGDVEVVSGRAQAGLLTALEPTTLYTLSASDLDVLFAENPAIALSFVGELGMELRWRNDLLREICLARAAGLPPMFLGALLSRSRRRLQRHRNSPLRRIGALLLRVLVREPSRRPVFWMFAGVVLALASARSVVAMILRGGLQDRLFALIATNAGHPMHIHHFNYGLVLMSLVGLLALIPTMRRFLRVLSFVFGFGLGLVADEFALFWNLNPDYYQTSSRLAAALVIFILVQIVYFRTLYVAIGRRLVARVIP